MDLSNRIEASPLRPGARADRFLSREAWAMRPEAFAAIEAIVAERLEGFRPSKEEIAERLAMAETRISGAPSVTGEVKSIAVIPLVGCIARRMDMMMEYSGGTSTERFLGQLKAASIDPSVSAILIHVDSPGGTVDGTQEVADWIGQYVATAGHKRIEVYAEHEMCSAAYYIGSQAEYISSAPGAMIGSLGTLIRHSELSKANEMAGVGVTYIKSPADGPKGEGNRDQPLEASTVAHFQSIVDLATGRFYEAVARGRGVPVATVSNTYGRGRCFEAEQALGLGMIDTISTFEQAVARLDPSAGEVSSATEQEDEPMAPNEEEAIAKAVALALEKQLGPAMETALESLRARVDGIATSQVDYQKAIDAKIEEGAKATAKAAAQSRLQACASAGQIAPAEVGDELDMLMAVSPELREKGLARIEARPKRVPTTARSFGHGSLEAAAGEVSRDLQAPDGYGARSDSFEAECVTKALSEGLDPKDQLKFLARVTELMEVADA